MQKQKPVSVNHKIQGGAPCLTGTRIPVSDVVYLVRKKSISPKLLVTEYFTQLSLDQVRAALDWFDKSGKKYA
jgi:uncharacterized protein (DUF433 family)